MRAAKVLLGVGLLLSGVGCPVEEVEGDEAEECRDGADNDLDGYFDCQDNGCWNSPDCAGDDDDTGDDDDATGDDDDDTGDDDDTTAEHPNCGTGPVLTEDISGFVLTYSLGQDFEPKPIGVTDCVMEYGASDTALIERRGRCISFTGPWSQTASDCLPNFDELVWTGTGDQMHAFVFSDDGGFLDAWLVTQSDVIYEPTEAPWAIYDMAAPYTAGSPVSYVEVVPVPEASVTVTHTVNVTFTTD